MNLIGHYDLTDHLEVWCLIEMILFSLRFAQRINSLKHRMHWPDRVVVARCGGARGSASRSTMEANSHLEKAVKGTEFLANMSHEIRHPDEWRARDD